MPTDFLPQIGHRAAAFVLAEAGDGFPISLTIERKGTIPLTSMRAKVVAFGLLALFAGALPASADSIYDAKVEQKLELDPGQKAKVSAIVKQSNADMNVVFKKYGIDPNAAPNFDKLTKASDELQAIGRRERNEMKKILNKAQLKQYDKLIADTGARVRKAAK
jgi:hypothetical protein